MAQLSTKIRLYCEANSKVADFGPNGNISLHDDSEGNGPYIKTWSVDGLDKPSNSKIAEYETAGNTQESNNAVRATRKNLYGNIGDQLDEIYKDIDAWKARIKKIKDDNPKS